MFTLSQMKASSSVMRSKVRHILSKACLTFDLVNLSFYDSLYQQERFETIFIEIGAF